MASKSKKEEKNEKEIEVSRAYIENITFDHFKSL